MSENLKNYIKAKILGESFESLNKTPQDKEQHVIYDKKNKNILSSHSSKGEAYNHLINTHKFDPNLTVLHKSQYHIYNIK